MKIAIDPLESGRREAMKRYGFGTDEMKKIKICSVCGAAQPLDAKNCSFCQTALNRETLFDQYKSRHLVCAHCDAVVADRTKYCPACGKRIKQKAEK